MPDRTVFITGCSSGIGRAAALLFCERGYRVVATARKPEPLAELADLARRHSGKLHTVECDVTSRESVAAAVDFAHRNVGPVHILVNNAGFGLMGPVELVPLEEARRQLEVNTLGAMRLVQHIVPDMRAARWGRIINVSSIAGRIAVPFGGWYSASKFALEGLSASLRLELEPFGIRTVCIEPGPVRTEFLHNARLMPPIPDPFEDYRIMYDAYDRYRRKVRTFEIDSDQVVQVIVRAAEAKYPRPRYVLTIPAKAGVLGARLLTDRIMDHIILLFFGISVPPLDGKKLK